MVKPRALPPLDWRRIKADFAEWDTRNRYVLWPWQWAKLRALVERERARRKG